MMRARSAPALAVTVPLLVGVVLSVIGVPAGDGWPQTLGEETVLGEIRIETERLEALLGRREVLARIREHLAFLDQARGRALGGRIPPEYAQSLAADLTLLRRSRLEFGADPQRLLAAVTEVAADLEVKRRHGEAALGLSAGGLRNVQVVVRTLRGDREEPNHFVWYVARGWSDDRQRFRRFDRVSSPTETTMAPGNYYMWAGTAHDPDRHLITIGGHGQRQHSVDLKLP
jgi:hypothetical protein